MLFCFGGFRLEYEKALCPFLLFKKKRYAGLMFTKPDSPDKMDSKGIQLVRRDVIPYVREVSKAVLDMLMNKRNMSGARFLARDAAKDLIDGKIPMEKLILSKSLQKTYKSEDLPHLAVAKRIEERDPGSGPRPGDRVPYVFVEVKDPRAKQIQRAEDPAYAKSHSLKLDYAYYLEHQFVAPIVSLLELVILDGNPRDVLFGDIIRRSRNQGRKQREITSFFSKSAV